MVGVVSQGGDDPEHWLRTLIEEVQPTEHLRSDPGRGRGDGGRLDSDESREPKAPQAEATTETSNVLASREGDGVKAEALETLGLDEDELSTVDTAKALETFKNDYLVAALEADPVGGALRASNALPIYIQTMELLFVVVEPVVSGWELNRFDSRTDALILSTLALVANNSLKEGRELPDIDVMELCFRRVAQRCPSALTHMNEPDWTKARHLPSAPSVAGIGANTVSEGTGSIGTTLESPELNQIKASTKARLQKAAEHYDQEQLMSTLEEAPTLLRFGDLDRAVQAANDTIVRTITEGGSDEVLRYCESLMLSGYIVGRAMLGTERGVLHYSNPSTEQANAQTLIRLTTTPLAASFVEEIGPMGHLYVKFQIEMASRAEPLSYLANEDRERLTGASAIAGLVLAIVEHDLFAAGADETATDLSEPAESEPISDSSTANDLKRPRSGRHVAPE